MSEVADNLRRLRSEIPAQVQLLAVSKRQPHERIQAAYDAGQRDFGENKVQELLDKVDTFPDDLRWHLIGHLQRNKVKFVVPFVHLIHSVDSLRLMNEIEKQASKIPRIIPVLLQLRIAREESKFGLDQEAYEEVLTAYLQGHFPHIELKGLMGMATNTEDQAQIREEFKLLADAYQDLRERRPEVSVLSMGMSGDMQIAIEEGSNMVRVGTSVFGPRPV
mgnify:CR=1 FL=1